MCLYIHVASETNVSVVVNSTCTSSSLPQDPVIVTQLPVTLTCCVEGCPNWIGHWYRQTDYGTNRSMSVGPTLTIKILIETQETFICVVLFDSHSDNPLCHDDQHKEGSITLIKCKYKHGCVCVNHAITII